MTSLSPLSKRSLLSLSVGASALTVGILAFASVLPTRAQSSFPIYADSLANGWENWSWATVNLANSSPVHSGSRSISVSSDNWQALYLHHSSLDGSLFSSLHFWIHGGATGGQVVRVQATRAGVHQAPIVLAPLPEDAWREEDISLASLGVESATDFDGFWIQVQDSGIAPTFYVDDIELTPVPLPTVVHLDVDATQSIRTVDNRWFGVNTAIWDGEFEKTHTVSLLEEMGITTLRFPGGSLSDLYHWATGTSDTNTWKWVTSFEDFAQAATNIGAAVFITVNYGTGTPEEAAGWVRHANVTNALGFQYWEIGNENYGRFEADDNVLPHHAYTYATRAQDYMAQMKAADPTIKVGMVVVPGEDSHHNGYTDHPAINPRTGQTNYGWTPVLLTTLKELGVTPDFLVHHHYPQWTNPDNPSSSPDNDVTLLQSTSAWANHAADLRRQIEDYFGPGGTNIELVVTENNSDAGAQGRQSTSLVNGLYYADSLGELMKTEFNAFVWWDLRNSRDTGGYFGPEIYGWRDYGDLGMINGPTNRHPTFYAAKLIQHLAREGDVVVRAASDYYLLAAHAVRKSNGAMTLLVLNKSLITNLNAEINIAGFAPDPTATVRSYGIPQDEAARTNGPFALQDIELHSITNAGTNFTYNFPPLSLTVFTLPSAPPGQPTLRALSLTSDGEFIVELQGEPGVAYAIQKSNNLLGWEPVSTNTLSGSPTILTNPVAPGQPYEFWRAVRVLE